MAIKGKKELAKVVIKFAGDSGDGMQLTGQHFTFTSALQGNDLATFPDFPAEIRAPAGTLEGVSGFQVQIGRDEIYTPGDTPDVLVVMNPAALKANISTLNKGKTIIADIDGFSLKNLTKIGYTTNPLDDGTLENYYVIKAPITTLTKKAISHMGLDTQSTTRCKNMFALGLSYWLFNREISHSIRFIKSKFKNKAAIAEANVITLQAGYFYGETIEAHPSTFVVNAAKIEKGKYRQITGNVATAWGLLAASEKTGLDLFYGSYPITPASDILHEVSKHKSLGVKSFQAEDEIAAVCAAIGASYAGNIGVTATSGPGLSLKSEAIGLAVMTELPLVIINVQRGGPSTGLPTKTEQSDLLQALYGRHGESPAIVISPSLPSNCFEFAYEAVKLALEFMSPVIFLSDAFVANGSEPWKIPDLQTLKKINIPSAKSTSLEEWDVYKRKEDTLARLWAVPGQKGFEHRIGGLEKEDGSGNVSYDPINHENMVKIRADKVNKVVNRIPPQKVKGNASGKLLVVGWGGTYGALLTAVNRLLDENKEIGLAHFNYINPLPSNTEQLFKSFDHILVCELNDGQFASYLRSKFEGISFKQYNKIQGQPFRVDELIETIKKHI